MSISLFYSVVIPAYNRAAVITETIASVQKQTFQDFEIIVVDDGSQDNTEQVVASINDSRIRYIKQANGGATNARNTGIKAVRGRYIAFLDSDDLFRPEHLALAVPVLQEHSNTCVYTQVIVDRGNGLTFLKPSHGYNNKEHISEYLLCRKGFVQTSTLVVPSQLAKQVMYDESIGYGDDIDMAIRLVLAGGDLKMLPEPGAVWKDTWDEGRLSSKIDPLKRLLWLEKAKPILTRKAYYAVLGRSVAKGYSQNGQRTKAAYFYFKSLLNGGFTAKSAISNFLQIVLSNHQYRRFSDFLAKLGFKP